MLVNGMFRLIRECGRPCEWHILCRSWTFGFNTQTSIYLLDGPTKFSNYVLLDFEV